MFQNSTFIGAGASAKVADMSSFMSDKYVKYGGLRGKLAGADGRPSEIDRDVPCKHCGYNLRGLMPGTRCPECGDEMDEEQMRRYGAGLPRLNIYLPEDPAVRRRMQIGFGLAAVSVAVIGAIRFAFMMPYVAGALVTFDAVLLAASVAWVVATFIITPKSIDEYGRAMRGARLAARWLQPAWVGVFLGALLADLPNPVQPLGNVLWFAGQAVGMAGTLCLLGVVSVPTWDADRDDLSQGFMRAFWGLAFTSIIVFIMPRGVAPEGIVWIIWGLAAPIMILWAVFMGMAAWTFVGMYQTIGWPSQHGARAAGRAERIAETRRGLDEQVAAKIRRYPSEATERRSDGATEGRG